MFGLRDAPQGLYKHIPKHGALIATRKMPLEPLMKWTAKSCYPVLFARGVVDFGGAPLDLVNAHIPNGSSNGFVKVHHCHVLSRMLRGAKAQSRVLTGDFNEPRTFLDDGRVIPFGGRFVGQQLHDLEHDLKRQFDDLEGPQTLGEWDRRVAEIFSPTFTGLTHALARHGGSMRPMPVTHKTRANNRFFDHVFVSSDLNVKIEYLHELRDGISDHSAAWVVLSRGKVKERDEWEAG